MLHYLKEYGRYAEITGYKNIKFTQAEAFLKANRREAAENVDLQFFDAELIAAPEHLYFAVLNALQAFQGSTNISKSLAMETILYASAQRQIQKAIQRCGIKAETTSMAVVIIGCNPAQVTGLLGKVTECMGGQPDEKVLELTELKAQKIIEAFQISEEELSTVSSGRSRFEAVSDLVIERAALLSTQL